MLCELSEVEDVGVDDVVVDLAKHLLQVADVPVMMCDVRLVFLNGGLVDVSLLRLLPLQFALQILERLLELADLLPNHALHLFPLFLQLSG